MLPSSLFSTYTRYKENTKKIVEWLGSTAERCGYALGPASANAKKPKKRKGKAKRPAEGADNVNQNGTSSSVTVAPQKYVIKAHEFVPTAQSIADSKEKTIVIPLSIIRTF